MKKSLLAVAVAAACAPGFAAESSATLDRLAACSAIADRDQRLACFDRESAPVARPRVTTPPPPAAPAPVARTPAPSPVPPPAAAPQKSFGEEQLNPKQRATPPSEADLSLHARVTELRTVNRNTYNVTLDNGQVWRHENEHLGSYLREGDAITIEKGTLGSYRLTRDAGESRNWIRVTRVR